MGSPLYFIGAIIVSCAIGCKTNDETYGWFALTWKNIFLRFELTFTKTLINIIQCSQSKPTT